MKENKVTTYKLNRHIQLNILVSLFIVDMKHKDKVDSPQLHKDNAAM